jgi:hypothetical protein
VETTYDLAIQSAQESRFVHEEGLACELAALHHKAIGNKDKAKQLFSQAESCYKAWGSPLKTLEMTKNLAELGV